MRFGLRVRRPRLRIGRARLSLGRRPRLSARVGRTRVSVGARGPSLSVRLNRWLTATAKGGRS